MFSKKYFDHLFQDRFTNKTTRISHSTAGHIYANSVDLKDGLLNNRVFRVPSRTVVFLV